MKEIEPKFRTGDQVVLLDGKRTFPHPLWVSSMDKFVGCVGIIREVLTKFDDEMTRYNVMFDKEDGRHEDWFALERWLSPAQAPYCSDEINDFFEEIGG